MPAEALATLELNYGDSIYINDQKYYLNQTRPGEENIMRIPNAARTVMGLNVGDVIRDGDLRNRYNNFYAEKLLPLTENTTPINITEGVVLKNSIENGRTVDIFLNGQKISSSAGVIENGTYTIYVNGNRYKTFTFNENNPNNVYYVTIGSNSYRIEIGSIISTDMAFANASTGKFLNFIS
jgi:glucosyl-3-phosphoglycerate synthase